MKSQVRRELGPFNVVLGPYSYQDVQFFTFRRPKVEHKLVGFEFCPGEMKFVFDPESVLNVRYYEEPTAKLNISLYIPKTHNGHCEHRGVLFSIISPSRKLLSTLERYFDIASYFSFGRDTDDEYVSISKHFMSLESPPENVSPSSPAVRKKNTSTKLSARESLEPNRRRRVRKKQKGRGTVKTSLVPGMCTHCKTTRTPMWRRGPAGYRTLCNACGVKYMLGKLSLPEPADAQEGG